MALLPGLEVKNSTWDVKERERGQGQLLWFLLAQLNGLDGGVND